MAIDVKTFEEWNKILENNPIVIADFWAPWCGPCKAFAPTLAEYAEENPSVTVVKVNVDEAEEELAEKYGIRSIPTIMAFHNGELKNTKVGALSKNQLSDLVQSAASAA